MGFIGEFEGLGIGDWGLGIGDWGLGIGGQGERGKRGINNEHQTPITHYYAQCPMYYFPK